MKQESGTKRQNPLEKYCSPAVVVTTVDMAQILCQSEHVLLRGTIEMLEGDDNW